MKRGKRICKELKAVRRRIADENNIPLEQPECTHQGDCLGTCPRCESEVRYLEQALTHKIAMGKVATVAGLGLTLAACGGNGSQTLKTDSPLPVSGKNHSTSDSIPEDSIIVTGYEEEDFSAEDIPVPGDVVIIDKKGCKDSTPNPVLNPPTVEPEDELIGVIATEGPSYPGGEEALYKFLEENIQFPDGFCGLGTVVVKFVVEADGTITNPRVIRDIGGGCGDEALRVVKLMPKWTPETFGGKHVRSEFMLPIQFQLR